MIIHVDSSCFLIQLGSWASDRHVWEESLPRMRGWVPVGAPESTGRGPGGTREGGARGDGGPLGSQAGRPGPLFTGERRYSKADERRQSGDEAPRVSALGCPEGGSPSEKSGFSPCIPGSTPLPLPSYSSVFFFFCHKHELFVIFNKGGGVE